jgi:hypothetical protein
MFRKKTVIIISCLYIIMLNCNVFAIEDDMATYESTDNTEDNFPVSDEEDTTTENTTGNSDNKEEKKDSSNSNFKQKAELLILDKITARSERYIINLGEEIKYGTILISANLCWSAPEGKKPESKILMKVDEKKPSEAKPHNIFKGWILSDSIALSGIEHPVYDITLIRCY